MRYSRRQFTRNTLVASLTYPSIAIPLLAQSAGRSYTVRKGDTLSHIARHHQTTVTAIKRANNLTGDLIRIGQKITLPNPGASSTIDRLYSVRQQCSGVTVRRSQWQRIVVHHSAIKYGNATKYDATHRRRGMKNGLAYHFVIGNGIAPPHPWPNFLPSAHRVCVCRAHDSSTAPKANCPPAGPRYAPRPCWPYHF